MARGGGRVDEKDLAVMRSEGVSPLAVKTGRVVEKDLAVNPQPAAAQTDSIGGYRYQDLQLNAPDAGHTIPYYALKTSDGDVAGWAGADPGQAVRLVDPKTGTLIYEGTGPEGAKYAAGIAQSLTQDKKKKANWALQVDTSEGWSTAAADAKDNKSWLKKTLGKVASIALPVAGSLLLPGLGTALGSGMLAAGAGGALGSGVASAARGKSLESALKSAALAGIGSGLASGLGGASLMSSRAAQGGLGGALTGQGGSNSLLGSAGTDVLGGIPVASGGDLVVTAAQQAARQGLSVAQMAAIGIPAAAATAAIAGLAGGGATGPVTPADPTTAVPEPATPVDTTGLSTTTPTYSQSALDKALAAAKGNPMLTARLLAMGAAALGGGGSSGNGDYSTNSLAGTRESLDPVFSMNLPKPTLGVRTPQTVNTDWSTYATRPEQMFFTRPQNFAAGGGVRGKGTGRSDSIAANLSDGEYVIDAETVALLGDGSSKAGAKKLDQFRVNVRKHKGRELAKGRFSVDARDPAAYMKGGRA